MTPRDNPFSASRMDALRCRIGAHDWRELLGRLDSAHWRGAIVGPHGHGKTTLLRHLASELVARRRRVCWVGLREERPALSREEWRQLSGCPDVVILLDGAEQLSWLSWFRLRWITRRTEGLIVTSHQPGRLQTVWECRTTLPLLTALISELSGCEPDTVALLAGRLFCAHQGDVREALRHCYDLWSPGPR